MAVKIGLRTRANSPPVTRPVRSAGSTPIRHESPIPIWAAVVATIPATASARPTICTVALSSGAIGSSPASPAIGAANPATRAATNPSFAHHWMVPASAWRRSPVSPVWRHWTQVRHPNATAANAT
jgi:hypothetical protein